MTARPMKAKVAQVMTAQTAQYQSEPWVVMLMSEALPLTVLPACYCQLGVMVANSDR